jgi:LacI family transcriptional regulator
MPATPSDTLHAPGAVTLDQVADAAGVSPSTVSRVLNRSAKVSEAKRRVVEETVARLNFQLNPLARGLALGRSMSIGVVTQAMDSPFYGEAMRGVEDALDGSGFMPLFISGHWSEPVEARCLQMLQARRVDGVVVLHGRLSDAELMRVAERVPVVVTGRRLQGRQLLSFSIADHEGAVQATQHLLELGHRRIAHVGGPDSHPDAMERMAGYRHALEQAGVAFDSRLVAQGELHEQSGAVAMRHLLDNAPPFTAVFAANDQMAFGAQLALRRSGLRVPQDVSLVGFDDLPVSAFMMPPLTTVRQPARDIGRIAVQGMLALIEGRTPDLVAPALQLIVRESTQAPAAAH